MAEPFQLGEQGRDVVTGFVGTVIARAEYLYEETSLLVVAETKQAAVDSRWIPETRVEPTGAKSQPPGFSGG